MDNKKVMPEQEAVAEMAVTLLDKIFRNLEEQGYRLVRVDTPEPLPEKKSKHQKKARESHPLDSLRTHVATGVNEDNVFSLGDVEVSGKTLKECAIGLLNASGLCKSRKADEILKILKSMPASDNVELLVGILEEKQ